MHQTIAPAVHQFQHSLLLYRFVHLFVYTLADASPGAYTVVVAGRYLRNFPGEELGPGKACQHVSVHVDPHPSFTSAVHTACIGRIQGYLVEFR